MRILHGLTLPRRSVFLVFLSALILPGCAVHYFDAQTGTEHLWGFGHLKMLEPPKEGQEELQKGIQKVLVNYSDTISKWLGKEIQKQSDALKNLQKLNQVIIRAKTEPSAIKELFESEATVTEKSK